MKTRKLDYFSDCVSYKTVSLSLSLSRIGDTLDKRLLLSASSNCEQAQEGKAAFR